MAVRRRGTGKAFRRGVRRRRLGASLVSEYGEGAVHRSHAVVAGVTEGVTVDQLSNYDLAYAPPFNTTWDPVLTAAKVLGGEL